MFGVYIIQSVNFSEIIYVGFTINIRKRIKYHNQGASKHTKKYMPWRLKTCIFFSDENKALEFERYLKTPSGKAFMKKRLLK